MDADTDMGARVARVQSLGERCAADDGDAVGDFMGIGNDGDDASCHVGLQSSSAYNWLEYAGWISTGGDVPCREEYLQCLGRVTAALVFPVTGVFA